MKIHLVIFAAILSVGALNAQIVPENPRETKPDTESPTVIQTVEPGAMVSVGDVSLFRVYAPLGAFTPAERATHISMRLKALAENPLAAKEKIHADETLNETIIYIGKSAILVVTDEDARVSGKLRRELVTEYTDRLKQFMENDLYRASWESLLMGVVFAAIATVLLIVILWLLAKFFRRFEGFLAEWMRLKRFAIRIQSVVVLSGEQLSNVALALVRGLRIAAILLIAYIYLPLVFSFFPWTKGIANQLLQYITDPLKQIGNAVFDYIPSLFFVIVILLVARYVLKIIELVFREYGEGNIEIPGFRKDWASPTYKIVRFLFLAFVVVLIFPYLPGSSSPAFQGISIFVGVLFSLGSSSAVSNIIAGVVLTYMSPFTVGDRVKIADTEGDVMEKTLLVTRVRTSKNVEITIPNSMILGTHIINYSTSGKNDLGLILNTTVTIGYDVPWRDVHKLLLNASAKSSGVLETPKPFILQTSLDDFYVSYELNVYTNEPNKMAMIYSSLHENIQDMFNEAGVEILSPHYRAARDGNMTTIPSAYLPKDYVAPQFRIDNSGKGKT